MFVKPVDPNAVIRDPVTRMKLPAEGGEVPDNLFWQRRLFIDKTVVLATPPTAQPAAPAAAAPAPDAPAAKSAPAATIPAKS